MVNILVLLDTISNYSKSTIDKGKTPLDVYNLCSIIREAFCYSYSIRKNNVLFFYVDSSRILIKFDGEKLRYLGSDERSQALLLKKALDKSLEVETNISHKMQKSTPGIFVKKLQNEESILENIKDINSNKIAVINEFKKNNKSKTIFSIEDLENLGEYCYIYPYPHNSWNAIVLTRYNDEKYNLIHVNLSSIKGIENKILYINFLIDQNEKSSNKIE